MLLSDRAQRGGLRPAVCRDGHRCSWHLVWGTSPQLSPRGGRARHHASLLSPTPAQADEHVASFRLYTRAGCILFLQAW